jgi:hypothetical protein
MKYTCRCLYTYKHACRYYTYKFVHLKISGIWGTRSQNVINNIQTKAAKYFLAVGA